MITERLKYNRKVHEHIGKFIELFPELRYGQILGSLGMTYPNDVFNDEPQVLHERMVAKEKELGWYDKLNAETKSDLPIKQTRDVLLTFETYIPFDGEWSEGEDICYDNGWDIKGYYDINILKIDTIRGRTYYAVEEIGYAKPFVKYRLIDGQEISLNVYNIHSVKNVVLVNYWKNGDEENNYIIFLNENDRIVNEVKNEEIKKRAQKLLGEKVTLICKDEPEF